MSSDVSGATDTDTDTDTDSGRQVRPNAAPTARFIVLWETPSDPAAFERHYRDVHIPLGRSMPGLRRYTLGRDVSAVRGDPYYLVAALEWDTMDELRAAFASPAGRATAADVNRLQQYALARSMIIGAEDDVL